MMEEFIFVSANGKRISVQAFKQGDFLDIDLGVYKLKDDFGDGHFERRLPDGTVETFAVTKRDFIMGMMIGDLYTVKVGIAGPEQI